MSRLVKRTALAFTLISSCASSIAMDSFTGGLAHYNFEGVSIGLGIGYNGAALSPSLSNSVSATNTSITKANQALMLGYVDLGYSLATPSKWFVGGDFSINLSNKPNGMSTNVTYTLSDPDTTTELSIKDSTSFSFTLDALGGYMIADDALLYLRLGTGYAATDVTASTSTTTGSAAIRSPATTSESLFLLRAGLGLKYAFAQNFNVTLSYIHTMTQNISRTVNMTASDATDFAVTSKQKPSWNALMVGLEIQCSSVSC